MTKRLHADEVSTDSGLVRRLLAAQFPQWADLPIAPLPSSGTDHAIYRLGDDLAVRLPRIQWATAQAGKEFVWLPRLAPHLPLALPQPLALGRPGEGYPWAWSVYRWLEGESAALELLDDLCGSARELAHFLHALQALPTQGAPRADPETSTSRGLPLATRDAATRQAIAALSDRLEAAAALKVWQAALDAPTWAGAPVWFHGDLLSGNLLVRRGRLSAVIDFGGLGVGDPACDLMIAWSLFSGESREAFRAALPLDDAAWARGRGHALSQAALFIPYYRRSNLLGVARAERMLGEVLAGP